MSKSITIADDWKSQNVTSNNEDLQRATQKMKESVVAKEI
jgi:hypothetical protein